MLSFVSLTAALALAGGAPTADAWPGFRGRGDAVSTATQLPVKWSPKENIAWKVVLPGYGQSSPVVWKDRVFVTAVSGDNREKGYVRALDAKTGKTLWTHEFAPTQKAKWSYTVSKAAPTPVVDADAVYTFFEGGDVLALSHAGKLLWSRSLVKDYGEFQGNHGLASSPTATEDALVLLVDHSGPSYLLALDKKTGKNRWKTERTSRGSWASPVVARRDGADEVVVSSNGSVASYDARTGKLLWEMDGLSGNTMPSASIAGDRILVGAGISRKGGDPAKAAKSNCCLQLVQKDGKPGYELRWSAQKASASYATPLAHRGHAYFVNQSGVVFCIDLATGAEKYAERIDGPCWASPIGAGDHVYFFGKDGRTTVLKAGPTFEKVASNALWSDDAAPKAGTDPAGGEYEGTIAYGVAVIDNAFFVRTGTALIRISTDR